MSATRTTRPTADHSNSDADGKTFLAMAVALAVGAAGYVVLDHLGAAEDFPRLVLLGSQVALVGYTVRTLVRQLRRPRAAR